MISRLVLIFFFFALVVFAVKKTFSPQSFIIESVPGYAAPVALNKATPQSDDEFLAELISAADYAQSFDAPPVTLEQPQKRELARKTKSYKKSFKKSKRSKKFSRNFKRVAVKR